MSGYAAYDAYIGSVEWAERREQFYANNKRYCRACYSHKRLNVHHRTYERMGAELDEDLICLCERCHKRVHDLHNLDRSQNLAAVTDLVITTIKAARKARAKPRVDAKKAKRKAKREARTPEENARRAANRERVRQVRHDEERNVLYSVGTPNARPSRGKVGQPNQRIGSFGANSNKQAKRLVAIEQFKKANGWS